MKKHTMFLLWLGAAISISEIFTGGLLAPLGLAKGLAAILIGHIIGVSLLAFGGYISFNRGQNAMESVSFSLGKVGGKLVAFCNVLQLIGWTIVMIVQAGSAFVSVMPEASFALVALILAALVLVWALIFGSPAGRLNDIVVVLLSVLCLLLFREAMGHAAAGGSVAGGLAEGYMSMALAIELSIAMPVSWLPLVGDYSREATDKGCAVAMPFWGYFIGSNLMYAFGLYIAVTSGKDIFAFIAASSLRYPACAVVLLSTVTTAFLDLYSAAMSSTQLVKTSHVRKPILVIGLFAAAVAIFFPVERYSDFLTGFLTMIGTVFVPVYSVLFLDFLLQKFAAQPAAVPAPAKLLTALVGMLSYQLFEHFELGIPTLLSIAVISAIYVPFTLFSKGARI